MNSLQAIETIKEERINVISFFHKDNGDVRAAYLCTMQGTEVDLDSSFFRQYDLEEIWNIKNNPKTPYINKTCDYKITDKTDNSVIYEQS